MRNTLFFFTFLSLSAIAQESTEAIFTDTASRNHREAELNKALSDLGKESRNGKLKEKLREIHRDKQDILKNKLRSLTLEERHRIREILRRRHELHKPR